tara:strand:- start:4190 stop:4399 length:210 start_codon:yes stop_codon:yes gene_type:complete
MNKHWIEKIKISKKQVEAIIIPTNCDWNGVPKIDEMKEKGIESIVLNVEDFAEMFTVLSSEIDTEKGEE